VLTYRVFHSDASWYLRPLLLMSLVDGRCILPEPIGWLCHQLGCQRRAFPVAAAQIWNSLLEHIVSAPTLQSFRRHLITFLLK